MTYVISRVCQDCVDTACVEVCPVDCIVEHAPEGRESELPNQLFIDPESCIGCGVCEPECPWEAIYEEGSLPEVFAEDAALNAISAERSAEFRVPEAVEKPPPSAGEVAARQVRMGLGRSAA